MRLNFNHCLSLGGGDTAFKTLPFQSFGLHDPAGGKEEKLSGTISDNFLSSSFQL